MEWSHTPVVDNDKEIREIIHALLTQEGYDVSEARNGREALECMNDCTDLYILGIMMPYVDGYKLCKRIRKHNSVPILFLTARGTQKDKAQGFSKGANDYLAKPFFYSELLVRVKAIPCRLMVYQGKQVETERYYCILQVRDIHIEERDEAVYAKGEKIAMIDLEYQPLHFMATHKNQTFSAEELSVSVWNEPYFASANNTLMVYIRNVRKRVEEDARNPKYVKTIWGKGYRPE